jgi:chaperonin GroES
MSENRFSKIIIVGDRILIKPKAQTDRTKSGLFLPPGVHEKEKVLSGYVIKTGPGYAIPKDTPEEEWRRDEEKVRYVPVQAQEGDLAIFLKAGATEIEFDGDRYFVVPQQAVLLLERDEDLLS